MQEMFYIHHAADVVPIVQILDIPVPQTVDQLVEAFRHFDLHIPEQVIAVPKMSSSSRCSRTVPREPQTAEQLVDVVEFPLIEPIGDIPASSTVSSQHRVLSVCQQIVDIPVPLRGFPGDLQGFHTGQRGAGCAPQLIHAELSSNACRGS